MKRTSFVTTRSGGGKRIYRRAHRTLVGAMADADRAEALGRDVTITRRDLYEVTIAEGLGATASDVRRIGADVDDATSEHANDQLTPQHYVPALKRGDRV